jgi:hypothetical protein
MTQTTTRIGVTPAPPPDRRPVRPVRRTFALALLAALIVSACFGAFLKLHKVPGAAKHTSTSAAQSTGGAPVVAAAGAPAAGSAQPRNATALPPISGATRLVGIVPVGYADTENGAIAAATNYLTTLYGSTQILNDAVRAQVIAAIAQPGAADALAASMDPTVAIIKSGLLNANGQPIGGGVLTLRVLLAGYHVDAISSASATVEIWYEAMYGVAVANSTAPVQSNYAVDTIKLTWADSDWKWDASTETPGPTPLGVANGSAADISRMQTVLTTFTPYAYGDTP